MNTSVRLARSANDKMIAGVCGGLANYFGIDSTIVRLVFVLAVLSGLSPLIYIILWIVMPEEGAPLYSTPQQYVPQQPAPQQQAPQAQDPTGEWKYDPYTGEKIER